MQFGTLADRLGNGLQNRVEQFDSARYLFKLSGNSLRNFRFNCIMPPTLTQQYIYKRQTTKGMNKITIIGILLFALFAINANAQTSRRTIERWSTEAVKQITLTGRKPTVDVLDSLANNAEVSVEMLSRMGDPDYKRQSAACLKLIDHIVDYSQTTTGRRYTDIVRSGLKKALDRSYEPDVQLHIMNQLARCVKKGDAAHIAMYLEVPELAPTAYNILLNMNDIDDIIADAAAAQPGIKNKVKEILDIHAGKKKTPVAIVTKPKPEALPFWTESLDKVIADVASKTTDDANKILIDNKPEDAMPLLIKLAAKKQGDERNAIIARFLLTAERTATSGDLMYLLLRDADELTTDDYIRQRIIVALGYTHCPQAISYLRKYYGNKAYADALAVATTELIAYQPEANAGRMVNAMLYAAKQSYIHHYDEKDVDTRIDQVLAAIDNWHAEGGYNMAHTEVTRMEKRGFWVIHDQLADFNLAFDWLSEGTLTLSLRSMPVLMFSKEKGLKLVGDSKWHKYDTIGDWSTANISVNGDNITVSVNGQKLIDGTKLVATESGDPINKQGYIKFLADEQGATVREYCFLRK